MARAESNPGRGSQESSRQKERRVEPFPLRREWKYIADTNPPFWPFIKSYFAEEGKQEEDISAMRKKDYPDGVATLGGKDYGTDYFNIGFVKDKGRVRIARQITKSQARHVDGITKDAIIVDYDPLNYEKYDNYLQYYLSSQNGGVVIGVDIDDLCKDARLDETISRKHKWRLKTPFPTLEAAVKTAAVRPPGGVMAAKVPVVDEEGDTSERWHILHGLYVPKYGKFNPDRNWQRYKAAIHDLITHEDFAKAISNVDKVAYAIAGEVEYYKSMGKYTRLAKPALLSGAIILGANEIVEALSGTETVVFDANAAGLEAFDLSNISLGEGSMAASELGTDYSGEPQFGQTTQAFSEQENKPVNVTFSDPLASSGKDSSGNIVYINQMGTMHY